jgi:hypothetical protein
MALLLPFYILKIRKELKKKGTDSARKKALAAELKNDIVGIDKVLKKCKRNNYITDSDAAMLLKQLSTVYMELYGNHKEFVEVNMRLEKLVKTGIPELVVKSRKEGIIETAKNMLEDGLDLALIARYTKLSEKEILVLR